MTTLQFMVDDTWGLRKYLEEIGHPRAALSFNYLLFTSIPFFLSSSSLLLFYFIFANLGDDKTIPLYHVSFLQSLCNPGHVPVHTSATPYMS